jgi:hypothetical protein
MFCELNLFLLLFLGHLDGDHRLQMASWPSKFMRVRCRIRWCWMACKLNLFSLSWCFWVIWKVIRGSKWQADQAKLSPYESSVGIQWHTKACSELLMGMPSKAKTRSQSCEGGQHVVATYIERGVVRMWSS